MTYQRYLIGKSAENVFLHSTMITRHGLIAGATGTGKTVSLKVIAEQLSASGVPVFLSDVKGDLASCATKGVSNEKLEARIKTLGLENFNYDSFPVRLWDVFNDMGHPLRTSVSEMGPLLLSRVLDLNDVQTGVLHVVFRVADDLGLLLIDLKDLRSMLSYVGEHASELTLDYGSVSKSSIGAIIRALLILEDQGGDVFFQEPAIDIDDFLQQDVDGRGFINVLHAKKLMQSPQLYSTFLLYLLSELYENLPEVGDLDKPKLVFFFDEAHILFDNISKTLLDKIELVVRLIRSKGVGVFFITQNPIDIPDSVLSQLGNRIQHALRAFTPNEQKAVKAMANTFRQNPDIDITQVITQLKTGEALVSFLDTDGKPSVVQQTLIRPPQSMIGTLEEEKYQLLIKNSPFFYKYKDVVDKESAYEILKAKINKQEADRDLIQQEDTNLSKATLSKAKTNKTTTSKKKPNEFQKLAKSFLGTMSSSIGRELARGVFGSLKRR